MGGTTGGTTGVGGTTGGTTGVGGLTGGDTGDPPQDGEFA